MNTYFLNFEKKQEINNSVGAIHFNSSLLHLNDILLFGELAESSDKGSNGSNRNRGKPKCLSNYTVVEIAKQEPVVVLIFSRTL